MQIVCQVLWPRRLISKVLCKNLFPATKLCFKSLGCEVKKKEEHLVRTANQYRQRKMYQGIIYRIEDPTEEVRKIAIKVNAPGLTFKAGQWVDFYIPGVEPVVGLSMTSPPHLAETEGVLELAVRYSEYPPTYWLHKQCKIGDDVALRVGGEFFYDPLSNANCAIHNDLLLIGGGVGINPLASIAQHYAHLVSTKHLPTQENKNKMVILYSAKNQKALIFRDLFCTLQESTSSVSCQFYATETQASDLCSDIARRRINEEELSIALSKLNKNNVVVYICGPSSMTDEMEAILLKSGIPSERIHFEKWW